DVADLHARVLRGRDRALPAGGRGALRERAVDEHAGVADRGARLVGALDALPRARGHELVARLAALDVNLDDAGRALAIDLDARRVADLGEPRDRIAAAVVVTDPRDQPRPAAGHPEVPRDIRGRPAELRTIWEQVPQAF